jgi:hypothetical protein
MIHPLPLHFVELSGSGYRRGLRHGCALKAEIAESVQHWKDNLQAQRKQDPDTVIAEFHRDTSFVPAIQRWTPGLLGEVRGIAEGSGQTLETMLAFQCVDEIWGYLNAKAHHCSGVGLIAANGMNNGPVAVCVNTLMQLSACPDGLPVALVIRGLLARRSGPSVVMTLSAQPTFQVTHGPPDACEYALYAFDTAPGRQAGTPRP